MLIVFAWNFFTANFSFPSFCSVRPRVEELTVSENGTAGLDATFSCTFSGFPVPDVVWLKDGISLPTSDRISMTTVTVEPDDSIMNATNTLHISGLVLSDRANYSCMAENDLARPQELESDRLEFLVLCELHTVDKQLVFRPANIMWE